MSKNMPLEILLIWLMTLKKTSSRASQHEPTAKGKEPRYVDLHVRGGLISSGITNNHELIVMVILRVASFGDYSSGRTAV